ncbi:MAG: hypothetical protein ACLFSZ_09085 [Puniceicoccaceae bacterium]
MKFPFSRWFFVWITPVVAVWVSTLHADPPDTVFSDDFERGPGPLADHQPSGVPGTWELVDAIEAEIEAGIGEDGGNGLRLRTDDGGSGSLRLALTEELESIVWHHFQAALAPRDADPALDAEANSAFFVTSDGDLRLRDGGTWIEIDFDPGLNDGNLHEYSIRQDFVSQTWELWVDGSPATPDPLEFANPNSSTSGLRFEQDGEADSIIDSVSVAHEVFDFDRVSLDFLDDFERGPGTLGDHSGMWYVDSAGPGGEIKTGIGAGGSSGLEIVTAADETADLTLHLPDHWQAVSWKQFEAVLAPYADDADAPTIDIDSAVVFHLTESGDVRIRDGESWELFDLGLDTAARHRFTVRQDYTTQTWQLWIGGDLVTVEPAAFANAAEVPSFFRITQAPGRTSVFDDVAVTAGVPPGGLSGLLDYAAWRDDITWDGADNSPGGDPNGNRLSNLFEYGFGFADPVGGNRSYSPPLEVDPDTGEVRFTFRRNRAAEDLSFTVETSSDLSGGSWTPVRPSAADVTVSSIPGDDDTDEVTVRLAAPGDNLFVRLRIDGA